MLNVSKERQRAGTGQLTVVPWLLQQGLSPGFAVVTCTLPRICIGRLPNRVSSAVKSAFMLLKFFKKTLRTANAKKFDLQICYTILHQFFLLWL